MGSIPIVFDFLVPQASGLGLLEEEKHVFEEGWDIDIGDYPMAILTQGATCKDPIIELAPHVHVVQSRHARNPSRPSLTPSHPHHALLSHHPPHPPRFPYPRQTPLRTVLPVKVQLRRLPPRPRILDLSRQLGKNRDRLH